MGFCNMGRALEADQQVLAVAAAAPAAALLNVGRCTDPGEAGERNEVCIKHSIL